MMNIRYCLMASAAVALSAVPNSHAAYLEQISHNVQPKTESFLSAGALSEAMLMSSGQEQKLASVCFITDTEDCHGNGFWGSTETPSTKPDGPNWDVDDPNRCLKEGYKKLICNSLQKPDNLCPYDETYFEKCVCRDNLVICTLPNIGVGATCDAKYDHCCNNSCQSGYDTSSGTCRQASSLVTACGNKCYKVLNNTCSIGQLTAPAETGGYKNKIAGYTECGNACFQSLNDNCQGGYVKNKETGKCYETGVIYTAYGSACYKEKACCDDTCSGYRTVPTTSQCRLGYTSGKTGCGNDCYTCRTCIPCAGYTSVPTSSQCKWGYKTNYYDNGCNNPCYTCKPCTSPACSLGGTRGYSNSIGAYNYKDACAESCYIPCGNCMVGALVSSDSYGAVSCSARPETGKTSIGVIYEMVGTGNSCSFKVFALSNISASNWSNVSNQVSAFQAGGVGGWRMPAKSELASLPSTSLSTLASYGVRFGMFDQYWTTDSCSGLGYPCRWTVIIGGSSQMQAETASKYGRPVKTF